jgi:hypothetical protein
MGAQEMKNFWAGKDQDLSDMFIASLYKNFGLSEYLVKRNIVDQGSVLGSLVELMTPPIDVVDSVIGDLVNFGQRFQSLKYMPIVGRFLWNRFGGGLEQEQARQEKARKESRTPERVREFKKERREQRKGIRDERKKLRR